jgi:hypothetical protein
MDENLSAKQKLINAWRDSQGPIDPEIMLQALKSKTFKEIIPLLAALAGQSLQKRRFTVRLLYKVFSEIKDNKKVKLLAFWGS